MYRAESTACKRRGNVLHSYGISLIHTSVNVCVCIKILVFEFFLNLTKLAVMPIFASETLLREKKKSSEKCQSVGIEPVPLITSDSTQHPRRYNFSKC